MGAGGPRTRLQKYLNGCRALVSRQKVKGKPLKSVRDLNYARERERVSAAMARARKKGRWLLPSRRKETFPYLGEGGTEEVGQDTSRRGKMGSLWKFLFRRPLCTSRLFP